MPRLNPLEPPFTPDAEAALNRMSPPGAQPIALFRLFAGHLPRAAAITSWGTYCLGRDLSISRRHREIVIDRTCARTGCEYEWGVHIAVFAERVALTPAQIRSLTHGAATDDCWPDEPERLLIEAVDSLHDTNDIGDALWDRLAAEFTQEQLTDVLLLTGWYHAISYTARAARLPQEPNTPRFADV